MPRTTPHAPGDAAILRRPVRRPSALLVAVPLAAIGLVAGSAARPGSPVDPIRREIQRRVDRNESAAAESLALATLAGGGGAAPSPLDSAGLIDDLVRARWRDDRARVPGTTALAERGLQIRLAAVDPDSLDLASSFESMAYQSAAEKRLREGEAFARRAIAIRRARLGPDDERIARMVHHLGVLAWGAQDYRGAGERFGEALAMRERSSGPATAAAGRSLMGLASTSAMLGRTEQAVEQFVRAAAIYEAPATAGTRDLLFALNSLAICYGRLDRAVETAETAERAVRVAEERLGPRHEQTANAYVSLAFAHALKGDFSRARDANRRAIEIVESGHGTNPSLAVAARRYLVSTLNNCGDYAAAAREAARALHECEALQPPDSTVLLEVCHGLGAAYEGLGRRREASRLYRRSVAIAQAKFGIEHATTAFELVSLAGIELDLGRTRLADSLFARARLATERSVGVQNSLMAGPLEGLALVRQARGRVAEADTLLAMARDILERQLGPDRVETGRAYGLIARLSAARGRRGEALIAALDAERISRRQFHLVAQGLAEREALRATTAGCSTLPLMLAMAADATGLTPSERRAVWDAVIRSRGRVLEEMARRRRLDRIPAGGSSRLADSLRVARANLAALVMRGAEGASEHGFRERVEARRRDAEALEEALALRSAALRRDRARDTLGLAEVERALPPATTLVAYVRYPEERPLAVSAAARRVVDTYVAFVRGAGAGEPSVVRLGAAAPIDTMLARWSAAVASTSPTTSPASDAERRARAAGVELRRALWDPLRAHVAGTSLVLIVPDGPLHLVNFAALPDDRGGYLVESGPTLQLLTAERDVVPDSAAAPGRGLIALGDPRFDDAAPRAPRSGDAAGEATRGAGGDCGAFRRLRFRRLPGTHDEIADIARLWVSAAAGAATPGSDSAAACILLEGARATESELARRVAGRRVVHLATHGFFLDALCVAREVDAPMRGVGGLAPWPGTVGPGVPPPPAAAANPLLLSGLALAGANHRDERHPGEDDGILTAEELASFDLSAVEWAVLSACRTGVGEIADGEGVFGLRRALRIAGARSVIISLWPVGDRATRQWMAALYGARLRERRSTAESVRAASLAVLRDRRARGLGTSPITWGAFLAAGEWR